MCRFRNDVFHEDSFLYCYHQTDAYHVVIFLCAATVLGVAFLSSVHLCLKS